MKKSQDEFDSFSELTKRLMSISKAEIDKRHQEWKKQKDRKHKPKDSKNSEERKRSE